jgi:hypothetical protein
MVLWFLVAFMTLQPFVLFSHLFEDVSRTASLPVGACVFLPITLATLIGAVVIEVRERHNNTWAMLYIMAAHLISVIILYADIYRHLGLLQGESLITEATDFIYFSVVTWTTLGYGDIIPSPKARLFAASEAMYGYIAMTLYLAVIFHLISARSYDQKPSANNSTDNTETSPLPRQ